MVALSVAGPSGRIRIRAAVDTGAVYSIVTWRALEACGIVPTGERPLPLATVGSRTTAEWVSVNEFAALGHARRHVDVVGHTLDAALGVTAVIGLDHLRGRVLTVDFNDGLIELT